MQILIDDQQCNAVFARHLADLGREPGHGLDARDVGELVDDQQRLVATVGGAGRACSG